MKGYRISKDTDHVNKILIGLIKSNGHCPCDTFSDDTNICPCDDFVLNGKGCKCALYVEDIKEKKE